MQQWGKAILREILLWTSKPKIVQCEHWENEWQQKNFIVAEVDHNPRIKLKYYSIQYDLVGTMNRSILLDFMGIVGSHEVFHIDIFH